MALLACATPAPPPAAPAFVAHFEGFDAWVDAAARGDLATGRIAATGLQSGALAPDAPELSRIGAAAGFAQMAENADELAFSVARAAAACGQCHSAQKVVPPPAPGWDHHDAGRRLAWSVVWARPPDAPASPAIEVRPALTAWDAPPKDDTDPPQPPPERRLNAALDACAGCHGPR